MNEFDLLKDLSEEAFAALGTPHTAYIKEIVVDGSAGYAICGADGSQMAVVADREVAFAAARQHDMYPVSVH